MTMKRIDFYYFFTLWLVLCYGALTLFGGSAPAVFHNPATYTKHTTKEQLASHMVTFLNDKGEEGGTCSATAIGPHAFLTARHCDQQYDAEGVQFDRTLEQHDILGHISDRRDHTIYITNGTPFTNYSPVVAADAVVGETVTMYGDGSRIYPPLPHFGKVMDCDDPSDLAAAAGEACFSLQIIPGDSGSAVYNTKGEIVGLITYSIMHEPFTAEGFALHFSQSVLDRAASFDGTEPKEPHVNSTSNSSHS